MDELTVFNNAIEEYRVRIIPRERDGYKGYTIQTYSNFMESWEHVFTVAEEANYQRNMLELAMVFALQSVLQNHLAMYMARIRNWK